MKLETENGATIKNPSSAQIEDALRKLADGGGGFAILSQDEMTYLQAAGNRAGGFVVEYQDGDVDSHFEATQGAVPLGDLEKAFRLYAMGDAGWKSMFEWQAIEI